MKPETKQRLIKAIESLDKQIKESESVLSLCSGELTNLESYVVKLHEQLLLSLRLQSLTIAAIVEEE